MGSGFTSLARLTPRSGDRDDLPGLALAENLDVVPTSSWGASAAQTGVWPRAHLDDEHMRKESEQALAKLDVHIPSLRAKIGTLSGGQRQAVAISRAVYWDARLMIMDEPTAALAWRNSAKCWK